ncbi:hypothetical protein GCM10020254_74270 [Streptomyces goshikiensis]
MATTKCQYCGPNIGVKIACRTVTSTGRPLPSRVKPRGVFIHELAAMMPKAPIRAASGSGTPSQKCVFGGSRRQP